MQEGVKIKLIVIAFILFSTNSNAKDFEGIIPLKSTQSDVERKYGLPEKGKVMNDVALYRYEDKRVTFRYAGLPCNNREVCECFVLKDTVISIEVVYEVYESFSALQINKKKFERREAPNDPSSVTYLNEEEGVLYHVDETDDDIISIKYLPSKKDCEDILRKINCKSYDVIYQNTLSVISGQ